MIKTLILLLLGSLLSIILIKNQTLSAPFVLVSLLWFILFLLAIFFTKRVLIRIVYFNIAVIIFIFGVFEVYFWKVDTNKLTFRPSVATPHRDEGKKYDIVRDDILGYALQKNSKMKAVKYFNDEVVYNVTYTVDKYGLRISPNINGTELPAVLFFGCSITYGEGVNDDETMPYVTGILTGGKYAIYNFGVPGYGPQHMLAAIENGIVDPVITYKPKIAIYQAIPDHVIRLKALRPGLWSGPHYNLDANGEIVLSSVSIPFTRVKMKLQKSYFLRTISKRLDNFKSKDKDYKFITTYKDIMTFASVVEKSKNLLTAKYPGIEFHVIFWDQKDIGLDKEAIMNELEKKEIRIHRISNIIQDIFTFDDKSPYRIYNDDHPTPLANRIIASYVVNEIIREKTVINVSNEKLHKLFNINNKSND